jgi:hypothetical protein
MTRREATSHRLPRARQRLPALRALGVTSAKRCDRAADIATIARS